MKKNIVLLLMMSLTGLFTSVASAVPVRATFDGAVSGFLHYEGPANDFPLGTAASFDVVFDDDALVDLLPVTQFGLSSVSGWLRLGDLEWLIDAGRIETYAYTGVETSAFRLSFTGTGPGISGDGLLSGLFLWITPGSTPMPGEAITAGFGYETVYPELGLTITNFGYTVLSGAIAVTEVPEPATGALILSAFALMGFARRRPAIARLGSGEQV
jgi:hypothetical protein